MSIELNLERLEAWQAKMQPQPLVQQIGEALIGEIQANWSGANPSEAGKPPAILTGELAASIMLQTEGDEARVGTNADYGAMLEYGTGDMAARPWLRPAAETIKNQISVMVREHFAR